MKIIYPEIQSLKNLISTFEITINWASSLNDLTLVELTISDNIFPIYIQDEYDDLTYNNPLLNLCLVLRELEVYDESSDYLIWCNTEGADPSNETLRQYYMNLGKAYASIEKLIGNIDSQISDLDFQLNAGAAQELRKVL